MLNCVEQFRREEGIAGWAWKRSAHSPVLLLITRLGSWLRRKRDKFGSYLPGSAMPAQGRRWDQMASPAFVFEEFCSPSTTTQHLRRHKVLVTCLSSAALSCFSFAQNSVMCFWCVIMDSENICLGNHKNVQGGRV